MGLLAKGESHVAQVNSTSITYWLTQLFVNHNKNFLLQLRGDQDATAKNTSWVFAEYFFLLFQIWWL